MMRSTFIGGGNMASAMIGGLLAGGAGAADIAVVEPVAAQRERLEARFPGVRLHASGEEASLAATDMPCP